MPRRSSSSSATGFFFFFSSSFVLIVLGLCFAAALVRADDANEQCTFTDPQSGKFFDLTDFKSDEDYKVDAKNPWDFTFYYHINVCKNVQMTCVGSNAPALQFEKKGDGTLNCLYTLGLLPAQFSLKDPANPDTGGVLLTYNNGDAGRVTRVYLACDHDAKPPYTLEFIGESQERQYDFKISGPAGCPQPGCTICTVFSITVLLIEIAILVFVILLVPAIIAYFVIGILIKKFALKKTGADMVPNVRFWKNFLFILKDGVVFLFSGIRDLGSLIGSKMRNYKQLK